MSLEDYLASTNNIGVDEIKEAFNKEAEIPTKEECEKKWKEIINKSELSHVYKDSFILSFLGNKSYLEKTKEENKIVLWERSNSEEFPSYVCLPRNMKKIFVEVYQYRRNKDAKDSIRTTALSTPKITFSNGDFLLDLGSTFPGYTSILRVYCFVDKPKSFNIFGKTITIKDRDDYRVYEAI